MKNIIIPIIILMISSCSDFIDLAPISNANERSFYKTADDINNAVIAAYKGQKEIFSLDFMSQCVLNEVRSDNTRMAQQDQLDGFVRDSGKEWYMWSWDKSYRSIFYSNLVIEKSNEIEMDNALREQYQAEVRFLRSLVYFDLVRNFGGVPIVTSIFKDFEDGNIRLPRNTPEEVYNLIIEDLEFAIENLPSSYPDEENIGRATSGAAKGILAKVLLTTGDASRAEELLREIVTSNQYRLLPDFSELWESGNGNNDESLFELQFKSGIDGAPMYNTFAAIGADVPGGGFGYNTATQGLVDAYEVNDPRKDLTINTTDTNVPYTIKYTDEDMTVANNADNNFPILRYAEVLLLLAESIGENNEAYELINRVRRRGFGVAIDIPDPAVDINAATPGSFVEKLLHERRVELAFEGHRWHDLLRFGVAVEVMNDHFQEESMDITLNGNDLLMPIPFTAIVANPKLEQNPGYD